MSNEKRGAFCHFFLQPALPFAFLQMLSSLPVVVIFSIVTLHLRQTLAVITGGCSVPKIGFGKLRHLNGTTCKIGSNVEPGAIAMINCYEGFSVENNATVCAFNGMWFPKIEPCQPTPEFSVRKQPKKNYCPHF